MEWNEIIPFEDKDLFYNDFLDWMLFQNETLNDFIKVDLSSIHYS